MKVALAQYEVERGNPLDNLKLIEEYATKAAADGADLLCLPEMATTGFDWKRNRELLPQTGEQHERLSAMARSGELAICGSFLEQTATGMPANTLLYFDADGQIIARYRKIHLFSVFREHEHVEAGNEVVVADIGSTKAGFGICYDLRFPELFRKNTELGAKLQFLPAAFPHPRLEHWRALIKARAIENQCYLIAVNQAGHEGHGEGVGSVQYFGHSMVVDPWGEVIAEAGEEPGIFFADIDLDLVDATRRQLPALKDRRPELFE